MPPPNDHFALANLYLHAGNRPDYEEQMHSLVGGDHPQPVFLMSYISTLLDRKEFEDADNWLQVLEKTVPDGYETMSFRADYFIRRESTRRPPTGSKSTSSMTSPESPYRVPHMNLAAPDAGKLCRPAEGRQKAGRRRFYQPGGRVLRNAAQAGDGRRSYRLCGLLCPAGANRRGAFRAGAVLGPQQAGAVRSPVRRAS